MTRQYKVGIYCRLSVEDSANSAKAKHYITADESVSIENQYELLSRFTRLNGWTEIKCYRDDGYSGGNFARIGSNVTVCNHATVPDGADIPDCTAVH